MATALADQWAASQDPAFQGKVRVALSRVAISVEAEDPATANHDARLTLAAVVLAKLDWYVQQASIALAGQGIDDTTDDTTVLGGVAMLVNSAATLRVAGNQA